MKSFVCYILVLTLVSTHVCAHIISWNGNFDDISLENIATKGQVREMSSTVTLSLDGDVEITANNTLNGPAELSNATDVLVTEYRLSFDGNGSSATGGSPTTYETYDSFLSSASRVSHVVADDDVDVTLHVRVNYNSNEVADSGTYLATQTLTVTWVGP